MSSRGKYQLRMRKMKLEEAKSKEPRSKDEILSEYQALCAAAGDKQYRLKVMSAELDQINSKLHQLNGEANARDALDKQKPVESPTVVESVGPTGEVSLS